jgi:hypothetical protein
MKALVVKWQHPRTGKMLEDGRGIQVENKMNGRYELVRLAFGPFDHVSQRSQRLMIHLGSGRANEDPDGHDMRDRYGVP